ncbi:DUF350 domain-containing protein [Vreelandella rituensis]|uniref:DUF350 domain-containing protein n=1 Tax=Vreelandella rituensis TaxID=2282306 RepID=A0A368UBB0_9GAMM|nr:DUF350 domain-containing protein [Halomonas rituensis]RCV93582.1 DUF350 domain-containing protein [Halomonas rituensis]
MGNLGLYLSGLPAFFAYLATAAIMLVLFMMAYSKITPHKEWALIREGNAAAATAFAGAILGFTIPLYSAMANSVGFIDFILWGIVAFFVQLVTFFAIKGVLRRQGESLSTHIADNHIAYGILSGAIAVAIGLLNAASMVW